MNVPRLVIAGLSGDSGKTLVSLSLITALRQRGLAVSAFKKGPDYIDAAWLSWVSGSPCRNLDTFMADSQVVAGAFAANAARSDVAIIEGNRGLFDGSDASGTHSTASLARLIQAPVILVVNCTKATRTIAALISGCISFEPGLKIAGVVLNQVAGKRHEAVIRESIEQYCSVPVLGAIPRHGADAGLIPGRHLGLVTPAEFEDGELLTSRLRTIGESYLDLDGLTDAARGALPLPAHDNKKQARNRSSVRVGYFRDAVFTFYYPENLEALEAQGAELVPVSSLEDTRLPELDALYIGGGFPEVHAERLVQNRTLMRSVRQASEDGLPIYAECGGLIYLSESITLGSKRYDMAGVFDVDLRLDAKPVGHGYAHVRIDRPCPFFANGTELRGHEFHYSGTVATPDTNQTCMTVDRGFGLGNRRDGLVKNNTLACYVHLHALGNPSWAEAIVRVAHEYRAQGKAGDVAASKSKLETRHLRIALSATPVNG
jgi:cobyrinic acid a,c-diamide synthase